jgi:hypothetical protein
VYVNVTKYNSSSANCTLTAELGTADATNTWTVGGTTVTASSAAQISSAFAYQSGTTGGVSESIQIAIPYTTANNTAISNTINFTATAN